MMHNLDISVIDILYRVRPVNPDNFEMPVSTPVMVVPDSARYH